MLLTINQVSKLVRAERARALHDAAYWKAISEREREDLVVAARTVGALSVSMEMVLMTGYLCLLGAICFGAWMVAIEGDWGRTGSVVSFVLGVCALGSVWSWWAAQVRFDEWCAEVYGLERDLAPLSEGRTPMWMTSPEGMGPSATAYMVSIVQTGRRLRRVDAEVMKELQVGDLSALVRLHAFGAVG